MGESVRWGRRARETPGQTRAVTRAGISLSPSRLQIKGEAPGSCLGRMNGRERPVRTAPLAISARESRLGTPHCALTPSPPTPIAAPKTEASSKHGPCAGAGPGRKPRTFHLTRQAAGRFPNRGRLPCGLFVVRWIATRRAWQDSSPDFRHFSEEARPSHGQDGFHPRSRSFALDCKEAHPQDLRRHPRSGEDAEPDRGSARIV